MTATDPARSDEVPVEPSEPAPFPSCPLCGSRWHGLPKADMWCPGSYGREVSTDHSPPDPLVDNPRWTVTGPGSFVIDNGPPVDMREVTLGEREVLGPYESPEVFVGPVGTVELPAQPFAWKPVVYVDQVESVKVSDLTPYVGQFDSDVAELAARTYIPPQIWPYGNGNA